MKSFRLLLSVVAAAAILTACEDESTIGESLIEDNVEIVIDSAYTVTGRSVDNPKVQSRTTMQLLGRINAEGFGSLTSDIVTQFISTEQIDTTGVTAADIDSVKMVLRLYKNSSIGDSLVPMGLEVYRLRNDKPLPSPIYSNFDPKDYYRPEDKLGQAVYSTSLNDLTDAQEIDASYQYINVKFPVEFGRELFNRYKTSPETFASPQAFAKWFPGLYIANSFGSGRVIRINYNSIKLFYHQHTTTSAGNDTIINKTGVYMAVSPEVITNNNITYGMADRLRTMAAEGKSVLVAPAGMDVEFRFPAREIVENYRNNCGPLSVVNSLYFTIPVERIANNYGIEPPPYILMVKKSRKEKFFADAQINDTRHAFYAEYNQSTNSYIFSSLRDYIMSLINADEITDEDVDFVITPVNVITETQSSGNSYYSYYYGSTSSSVVSAITPYVNLPVMCVLDMNNAKIKFSYSKQNLKN